MCRDPPAASKYLDSSLTLRMPLRAHRLGILFSIALSHLTRMYVHTYTYSVKKPKLFLGLGDSYDCFQISAECRDKL